MSTKNRLMSKASLWTAAVAATVMASSASADITPGVYVIFARHSNQVLDLAGISQANGAPVNQFPFNGGANQLWRITQVDSLPFSGTPIYRLIAQHSGKCLNGPNASTEPGVNLVQFTCTNGAQNEQFFVSNNHTSKDFGRITPRHSGLGLQIEGKSQANGAPLEQNFIFGNAQAHQRFVFVRVGN